MTEILDQSDLTERAARLVEAARRAGADSADTVCVRGMSLAIEVRLGKIEETRRAEGDDFTLRAFVGRRSATVSANVVADPAELAERAVAMAQVAPEDPYAGLADPDRLATNFPELDLLDASIPSAAELTEAARATEDAARAVPGITNSGGATAGWSLGGMVLATSTGFTGAYLSSRFSLGVSAIAGSGTGMERDYESEVRTHRADLADPASVGRKAGERAVRRLNPVQGADRADHRRLRSARLDRPRRPPLRAPSTALRSRERPASCATSSAPKSLRRASGSPTTRSAGAGSPRVRSTARGSPPEAFDLVRDGVLQTWFLDSASARELGLATNGHAARGGGNPSPGSTNLTLLAGRADRRRT